MLLSYAELIVIVLPGSRKLLLSDSSTHFKFKVLFRSSLRVKKEIWRSTLARLKLLKIQEIKLLSCYCRHTELLSHGQEHSGDTFQTKAMVTKFAYCCTTVMVTGESWRRHLCWLDRGLVGTGHCRAVALLTTMYPRCESDHQKLYKTMGWGTEDIQKVQHLHCQNIQMLANSTR